MTREEIIEMISNMYLRAVAAYQCWALWCRMQPCSVMISSWRLSARPANSN